MNWVLAILIVGIPSALAWAWEHLRSSVKAGRPDAPPELTPHPATPDGWQLHLSWKVRVCMLLAGFALVVGSHIGMAFVIDSVLVHRSASVECLDLVELGVVSPPSGPADQRPADRQGGEACTGGTAP